MIKFLAKNQIIKRIIVTILLTMEMFTIFAFDSNMDVYADSNSLRKTYLELMNGRSETEMSVDSMTMDDLKMISLYLSNFYMPFGTALDNAEDAYYKDNCITALVQIGFDKDMATNLVDYIYDMNLSTAHQLYFSAEDYVKFNNRFGEQDVETHLGLGIDDRFDPGIDLSALKYDYVTYMNIDADIDEGATFDAVSVDADIPLTIFDFYVMLDMLNEAYEANDIFLGSFTPDNIAYHYSIDGGTSDAGLDYSWYEWDWAIKNWTSGNELTRDSELSSDFVKDITKKLPELGIEDGDTIGDYIDAIELIMPGQFYVAWCDPDTLDVKLVDVAGIYEGWRAIGSQEGIPFYYINASGERQVVFSLTLQTAITFNNILRNYDTSNGMVGNAFYNMFGFEGDNGIDNMSDTEICASLMVFQKMYVDWVGNIICDFGDQRVVVIPGCINPYTFSRIDLASLKSESDFTDQAEFLYKVYGALVQEAEKTAGGNIWDRLKSGDLSIADLITSGFSRFAIFLLKSIDFTSVDTVAKSLATNYNMSLFAESDPTFNCVSTFGLNMLSDERLCDFHGSAIEPEIYTASSSSKKGVPMATSIKLYRGSRDKAEWDTHWGWGTGTGGDLKDFLENYMNVGANQKLADAYIRHIMGTPMITDNRDYYASWITDIAWYNKETNDVLQTNDFRAENILSTVSDFGDNKVFADNTKFTDFKRGNMSNFISFDSYNLAVLRCIYLTYAFAYANKDGYAVVEDGFNTVIDWKFNDIFPSVSGKINFERLTTASPNEMAEQTLSMVYYLLHPSKGFNYVATLFKRKIGAILLGWHEDIVGATSSNYTTGGTKYLGFSGYITTPRIQEISWINILVENYNSIIIYLIMIMSIILLAYVLLGQLSVQRGIIGLIVFSLLAFLPPVAINAVVDIINNTCDRIYNSKFDFWAITQTENIVMNFEDYANASSSEESFSVYLQSATLTSGGEAGTDEESGFSGVQVKWMTPKRTNDASRALNKAENNTSLGRSNLNVNMIISGALDDHPETFVAGADYLYRDYTDIYKHTVYGYQMSNDNAYKDFINPTGTSPLKYSTEFFKSEETLTSGYQVNSTTLACSSYTGRHYGLSDIKLYDESSIYTLTGLSNSDARSHGFAVNNGFLYNRDEQFINWNEYNEAILLPLNHSSIYWNIHNQKEAFENILKTNGNIDMSLSGLTKPAVGNFGADPTWFNIGVFEIAGKDNSDNQCTQDYKNMSTVYYMLYSESPFYYFNFNIRDQFYKYSGDNLFDPHEASKPNEFYRLWLYNNQAYFYNTTDNAGDGYGELRDFMNFHDFFYYIIPLFNDGNTLVDEFDKTFGMYTYDDCSFSIDNTGRFHYGAGGTAGEDGSPGFKTLSEMITFAESQNLSNEEKYKLWHDVNVWCLFYCYTTWLDTMQDCDYALPQDINIMGEKFRVERPLDPTSYYIADSSGNIVSGRYMIFSRSEMKYYGLDWSDLTTVEQKIITVQDNVYSETLNLTNYLSMSDETLIQAYSMIQLFEFNKAFSQSSFIGDSYELYPKGYELKAFSYDAYMRLILSEAGGDSLIEEATKSTYYGNDTSGNKSIYARIMDKTSLFFGISLIINDFLAVYCIPAFKLFFLIAVFLTSVALIVSSAIKLELNMINVVWKSLFAPLLSFTAISIGLGWLVSMFMSNGIQNIHKKGVTISLGDPTMTVLVMIVINVAALVLYFKLCKKQLKDLIKYAKAVGTSVGGVVTGLGHVAVGAFSANKLSQIAKNTSGVAGNAKQRGKDNNPTNGKNGSAVGNIAAGAGAGAIAGAVAGSGNNTPDIPKAGDNKYDVKAADSRINSNTQKKLDEEAKLAAARSKTFNGKNEANAKKAGDLANQAKDDWAVANNKNVHLGDRMRAGRSAIANGLKAKGYGAKAAVGAKVAKGLGIDKRVSRAELESKSRIDALNSAIKDDKVRRNIGANRDRINSNMNNVDKKAKLDAYKHAKARGMNAQSAAKYAKKGSAGVKAAKKDIKRHQKMASTSRSGRANVVKFKKRA